MSEPVIVLLTTIMNDIDNNKQLFHPQNPNANTSTNNEKTQPGHEQTQNTSSLYMQFQQSRSQQKNNGSSEEIETKSPIDLIGSFSDMVPSNSFIRDSNIFVFENENSTKQITDTNTNTNNNNNPHTHDKQRSVSLSHLFQPMDPQKNANKKKSDPTNKKKSKKAKSPPTNEEYELVLEHHVIAKNKDIEKLLIKHEPQVIEFRNKTYKESAMNGVTQRSNDYKRLQIIGSVVEYTYFNIEPPNEYTAKTDRKHFKEVAAFAAKFSKDRGLSTPITLIIGCWFHDIERFIPCTKCSYLPESVDKYRKQVIHPITSAKVAMCMLKNAPLSQSEMDRIYDMVLHHDMPTPRDDLIIKGQCLIAGASDDLMWELQLLMDADSFAFFQSTIYFFIVFKAKKNTPEWIWQRVRTNVKRLRPHLRKMAVQCINKLPNDVQSKMDVDFEDLFDLCNENDEGCNNDNKTSHITKNKVSINDDFNKGNCVVTLNDENLMNAKIKDMYITN